MNELTIGKLAKQANVHVETVRYYERRGLIPRPRRTVANYRLYSPENFRQVKFIKQAQGLGFSLREIKKLLTPASDTTGEVCRCPNVCISKNRRH